ncbi:MAG TPA: hypothetical protein VHZ32_05745 [Rhizomicrobium sp.]|jgi:hypothetical protein|nr:hypothetical protein [Rhizomicrobium sp.]
MSVPKQFTLSLAALIIVSVQAHAQTPYLNVRGSSFDIWCQEHMKFPAARCDKRTPEDEKAYEAYRDKIGDYEEALRLKRQQKDQVDKTILHNDPIDNPQSGGQ